MENTLQLPPRSIETELVCTCAWCNRPLYAETWVEERDLDKNLMRVSHNERRFEPGCLPDSIGQPFIMRCGQCWATKVKRPLWIKRLYRFFMQFLPE